MEVRRHTYPSMAYPYLVKKRDVIFKSVSGDVWEINNPLYCKVIGIRYNHIDEFGDPLFHSLFLLDISLF